MNSPANQFYCQISGNVVGPMNGMQLREAALAGIVAPTTLVANSLSGNWMPASDVHGLFDLNDQLRESPPPPPPLPPPRQEIGPFPNVSVSVDSTRSGLGRRSFHRKTKWPIVAAFLALLVLSAVGVLLVIDNRAGDTRMGQSIEKSASDQFNVSSRTDEKGDVTTIRERLDDDRADLVVVEPQSQQQSFSWEEVLAAMNSELIAVTNLTDGGPMPIVTGGDPGERFARIKHPNPLRPLVLDVFETTEGLDVLVTNDSGGRVRAGFFFEHLLEASDFHRVKSVIDLYHESGIFEPIETDAGRFRIRVAPNSRRGIVIRGESLISIRHLNNGVQSAP